MKTKYLLYLLFFCFESYFSFSQYIPLLQNNALWNEFYHFEASWNYSVTVSGDSTINGIVYKKVLTDFSGPLTYLLREDTTTKKVYQYIDYYPSGYEQLMYNFNMSIGDSIFYNGYPIVLNSISDSIPIFCYLDDSISCSINPLHVYRFNNSYSWDQIIWIEGIGSLAGLIFPDGPWCNATTILCHFDSNGTRNYYHKTLGQVAPCEGYVSVPVFDKQPIVKVFPNPVLSDKFFIEGNTLYKGVIMNIQGQNLREINLSGKIRNEIEVNLPYGIYFIEIELADGSKSIKKLLLN